MSRKGRSRKTSNKADITLQARNGGSRDQGRRDDSGRKWGNSPCVFILKPRGYSGV